MDSTAEAAEKTQRLTAGPRPSAEDRLRGRIPASVNKSAVQSALKNDAPMPALPDLEARFSFSPSQKDALEAFIQARPKLADALKRDTSRDARIAEFIVREGGLEIRVRQAPRQVADAAAPEEIVRPAAIRYDLNNPQHSARMPRLKDNDPIMDAVRALSAQTEA